MTEKIEKLAEIFPEVMTEKLGEDGKIKRAVDFETLREILGDEILSEEKNFESYNFSWVGKKFARAEAFRKTEKILRPCVEESLNFEMTENLYIEGDNLEVLKILHENFRRKVKMIYIDPPYNTRNFLTYRDNFSMSKEDFAKRTSSVKFSSEDGRFHSDWCSMIYSRLLAARELLREDGAIFISIDDNEQANLKKICDEVFGEKNFVGEIIRKTKSMTGDNGCGFNLQHENLLIYGRDSSKIFFKGEPKKFSGYSNPDDDPNGDWYAGDPSARRGGSSTYFEIENPYTHKKDFPPVGRYWAFSKKTFQKYIADGRIIFKQNHRADERGFIFKRYKKKSFEPVHSLFAADNAYMNRVATVELKKLFGNNFFSYPKPLAFIKKIIQYSTDKDSLILDFFSGSATTAHAVMQLNAEDGGRRKFIMVQLPEVCAKNSEAAKAGYKNICEIGKERIRLAGKKILEENPGAKIDVGFRVLKLDSAN